MVCINARNPILGREWPSTVLDGIETTTLQSILNPPDSRLVMRLKQALPLRRETALKHPTGYGVLEKERCEHGCEDALQDLKDGWEELLEAELRVLGGVELVEVVEYIDDASDWQENGEKSDAWRNWQ